MRTGMDLVTAWGHLAELRGEPTVNGKPQAPPSERVPSPSENERSLQQFQQMMGGVHL